VLFAKLGLKPLETTPRSGARAYAQKS